MVVLVNDKTFADEVLKSELPVLVDFYADWCGPCRMVSPVVDQLSDEYVGKVKFCKINVDESPETAQAYRIMSIPSLYFFKNGEQVDQIIGAVPKPAIAAKLAAL